MGSFLKYKNDFPERMGKLSKTMEDVAAAGQQVDTDIHMISDSIDIMADTSDSLSDYTLYIKEKSEQLKQALNSKQEELPEIVDGICELIEECNSLLFGFVEMSHEIQNVVRTIANDMDEVYEATKDVSDVFKKLTEEIEEEMSQ